ncbi:MAG: hypothetical protein ACFNLC_05410, partial [Prevotella denticola]
TSDFFVRSAFPGGMYCRQLLVDACLQEEQAAVRHSGAKIDINYKRKNLFPSFFYCFIWIGLQIVSVW